MALSLLCITAGNVMQESIREAGSPRPSSVGEPCLPARRPKYVTTVSKRPSGIRALRYRLFAFKAFSSIGRLLRPRIVIAIALPAIGATAVGGHYYAELSAQVDQRLRSGPLDSAIDIYSGPLIIRVGERLPAGSLANYLRGVGYTQRQPGDLHAGSRAFTIANDEIEIEPGYAAGFPAIQVQIDDDYRVIRVRDRHTGRLLESGTVEGKLLSSIRGPDRSRRIPVQFDEIPDSLRNAVLAIEDRRFFSHPGVDWRGVGRALRADVHSGEIVQGGSTLTQQLVKNTFFSPERSFGRKLKEAAMATIIETRLSKSEIFTLYCNDVYLGQAGTYAIRGFAEAAQSYFGKGLGALTLSESAFLAGLLHAPNRYLLMRDLEAGVARRNQVLDAMVSTGAIGLEQAEAAKNEVLQIKRRRIDEDQGATYFLDYLQRFMDAHPAGSAHAGHQIHTTLDPALQAAAFDAVTRGCSRLDKALRPSANGERVQAALVALDARTREVLAMIRGRSYDQSQLNRATDAFRQPGSAFKPIVYAAALGSRAYTLASTISDRPTTFVYDGGTASYAPNDFRGGFTNRDVTLREALSHSLNVPAVRLAESVGISRVAELAEDCGLPRPGLYPSMALGTSEVSPLQLASTYMAFADGGRAIRPVPIKYQRSDEYPSSGPSPTGSEFVFSPEIAYLITSGMESVINSGTAAKARRMGVQGAAAGKTGTTDRDGWF